MLKAFLASSTEYNKFFEYLSLDFIRRNFQDLVKLFFALKELKTVSNKESHTIEELVTAYQVLYPKDVHLADVKPMLELLARVEVDTGIIATALERIRERELALKISFLALDVADGKADYDRLSALLSEAPKSSSVRELKFVTDDLEELYTKVAKERGLRWRLKCLNQSLGSLREGDFGFVFARPETGKTTFLASETTAFADQIRSSGAHSKPILWFNNEEQGRKVKLRAIQAYFGVTTAELFSDIRRFNGLWNEGVGRIIRIIDDASISRKDVERIVGQHSPSLVIFDQIDKIRGFDADRHDLVCEAIYQFVREVAKTYCPAIGICQAGATGENKKWLTMNDVANSHTAKQGEADWMLGIGKIHDEGYENVRFLNLPKNKLNGDDDTNPEWRHGRFTVRIKPDIGRYEDWE